MATDATATAAAFVMKYDAMSAMCRNTEAENKRLLQVVINRDAIIAAGIQREKDANDKHVKLSAENLELRRGQLKIMTDHEEFMQEIINQMAGGESTESESDESDESAESTNGDSSDRTSLKRRRH